MTQRFSSFQQYNIIMFLSVTMALMIHGGYAAGILFSTTPQSINVSAGTMVEFTCAAPASGLTSFAITTTPEIGSSSDTVDIILSSGDRQETLSFIAPSDQTSINIACVATTATAFNQSFAVLIIQGLLSAVGNLTSTEVDHCTLHFTWTAPYTLQGVPINYYTINITRHSDGAVVWSDTTNTTEYLYSVSSLGETLEVVVAAVNGAGTGNATSIMRQTPSSIRDFEFISTLKNTMRTNISNTKTNWTYTFDFEEMFVCGSAISHVTAEPCLNLPGTVKMLPDNERRVMAKFTDLVENRKYTATLNINYNGGVVQQSQPVEISTFDVRNATLNGPVENGRVCLDVTYVQGHAQPASSFILFNCSITGRNMYDGEITQTDNCMEVDPHPSYTIIVTDNDDDAEEIINDAAAPVTIIGVFVPNFTATASYTHITVSLFNTATASQPPSDNDDDAVSKIVISTIGLVVVVLLTTLMIFTITVMIYKRHPDNRIKHNKKDIELNPSEDHLSKKQKTQTQEDKIIYADVGTHSQGAPRALPIDDDVQYGQVLMSEGQRQCLKRLGKMETLVLNYCTLCELLQPLALQWRQFGEILYLAPYLDNVQTNNSSDEECLEAVLKYWQENQVRTYTWETLVTVLSSSEVGATYFATELKKRAKNT